MYFTQVLILSKEICFKNWTCGISILMHPHVFFKVKFDLEKIAFEVLLDKRHCGS